MKLSPGRLLAGFLLTLAVAAPSAAATPVSVQIYGDTPGARLGPVGVDTQAAGVFGPDNCPNASAGGAIDLATQGNWDKDAFTQTILGETHDFTNNSDTWSFWINETYAQVGICGYTPQPGDRLLVVADHLGGSFGPTVVPLSMTSPSAILVGQPFTVRVVEHRADAGTATTIMPAVGVSVGTGGGALGVTDANGEATIQIDTVGTTQLIAFSGSSVPTFPRPLLVVPPTPGGGGTPTPEPTPTPTPEPTPVIPVPTVPTPPADTVAPVASVSGLKAGQKFRRGRGPRELSGRVTDTGAVAQVKLRLKRRNAGKCSTFSGSRERFRGIRCSSEGSWFAIGNSADWSYLLPARLPRGAYVLEVKATDAAGNAGTVKRVRFRVA